MGFWSRLLGIDSYDAAQRVLSEPYEPFMSTGGIPVMDPGSPLEWWTGGRSEVEHFWRSQPNLRKVVDFIARNTASIPLNAYLRESDTERRRLAGEPLADLMRSPQARVSPYRFWHSVISDGLLYDRWAVLVSESAERGYELVQLPSWRLRFDTDTLRRVTGLRYWAGDQPGADDWEEVPLDRVIFDHGYAPRTAGLTPVNTLRDVLEEAAEAVQFRREVWDNGARVPGYVHRPPTAGNWVPEQRDRFVEAMRDTYGKNGATAGGMPLLEDGMEIRSVDVFTPQDANDLEGRRLTAIEVAAAFHIAPELVGAQQGNYSNVREFRQMLYRDSLGPYINSLEGALNAQLAPIFADGRPVYIEANIESKLRGSFEEQAQIMQSATGAPWLTRNEARAMQNRPPVEGGDALVVPLNVLTGGQASPNDSGSQNRSPKSRRVKSARPVEQFVDKHAEVLRAYFARQERVVLSRLGSKDGEDWWDEERWDAELSDDLYALSVTTATKVGRSTLDGIGLDPDQYDEDRTLNFLRTVADGDAAAINGSTRDQVKEAVGADDRSVADVFALAKDSRALELATTLVTGTTGFATTEAARQQSPSATKTWVVTSGNPRASHAGMDGETVPLDEPFSNGLDWPGAYGDPSETANCACTVEINIP